MAPNLFGSAKSSGEDLASGPCEKPKQAVLAMYELVVKQKLPESEMLTVTDAKGHQWKVLRVLATSVSSTIYSLVYVGDVVYPSLNLAYPSPFEPVLIDIFVDFLTSGIYAAARDPRPSEKQLQVLDKATRDVWKKMRFVVQQVHVYAFAEKIGCKLLQDASLKLIHLFPVSNDFSDFQAAVAIVFDQEKLKDESGELKKLMGTVGAKYHSVWAIKRTEAFADILSNTPGYAKQLLKATAATAVSFTSSPMFGHGPIPRGSSSQAFGIRLTSAPVPPPKSVNPPTSATQTLIPGLFGAAPSPAVQASPTSPYTRPDSTALTPGSFGWITRPQSSAQAAPTSPSSCPSLTFSNLVPVKGFGYTTGPQSSTPAAPVSSFNGFGSSGVKRPFSAVESTSGHNHIVPGHEARDAARPPLGSQARFKREPHY
ncbi:hypothetical protein P154DRAFT_624188 [Amniculicola lignicola CBS 123094]|uniref:Uncharacterized protein n=1 Tax=Amniculicola lignicola CBS 123094 TaxID=1392246 RepID=A0A6A5W2E9_9PLEO|nr:hypothetical protein P154DRAFT_624188 [Amniculicola lignicola CBS 123094]